MKKDYCNVCGDINPKYSDSKRQYLCSICFQNTPKKESFLTFEKHFTGVIQVSGQILYNVKREFYEDYLTSSLTLNDYLNRI